MIASELVAAEGKDLEDGPDNFILAQDGKPERLAAETARVFMGINIQCAECHDHPFDQWKRRQFHELAAFFTKGTYSMPDLQHPGEKTEIAPKFLLGETPTRKLTGDEKRVAVAAYLIYNSSNYWFARAYVNRVWNELFGDGFYAVDSLGPDGEVMYKVVINRIAAVFRYRDFKPKWLMQTILNSRAYQRDIRTLPSEGDRFTALRPTRLRADQVADAVNHAVGQTKAAPRIRRTFAHDPSLPQRDIEGSIQQALLLMDEPAVQEKIADGPLKKQLAQIKSDREMVSQLYLNVLARAPTEKEMTRSVDYVKKNNRDEAIEDLMWTLINSAEFITKR